MSARRARIVPLGLCALCVLLAFVQDPGVVVADTKVNLYVAPARFLSAVVSAWTPTTTLGHVFSGQYGGYLFPMAPWFAVGHALAIPMWIVQRLWIAALLCLGAVGVVRLCDVWSGERRDLVRLVAGLVFTLNPYVVTDLDRTSIALLSYALLPWMLVAVRRGLHEPRGWRWPALVALLIAGSGGGVNAGVLGWVLLGPLLLIVYERLFGDVGPGAVGPYLLRAVPLVAVTSLWWVVGLAVNAGHGPNILQYTEQPGAIWGPTSMTESLRLMGFWPSYFGQSYAGPLRPFYAHAGTLLFARPVVCASLLVPALALAALPWTLRRRHAPFALALVLVGLLAMTAGFPNGTLLRHGLSFGYYHVGVVQALRTTYKAGPLVAVGLAYLAGLGASAAAGALRSISPPRSAVLATGSAVLLAALLIAGAGWPLLQGRGLDAALALPHGVPAAWQRTATALDDELPSSQRAMVLPGQLFGAYRWGETVDPILPQLAHRAVTERGITPYADLRADSLQWATDALVSQQRALPGQLRPLLTLMGVGAVVAGADGDRARSGELSPADAARVLDGQGLGRASGRGPRRRVAAGPGELAGPLSLAQVRTYRVRGGSMLRVLPRANPTILDGDGTGVADLAGSGGLSSDRALRYAADLTPAQIRRAAAAGADLVVTDSDRRQILVTSTLEQNTGPVLDPTDPISPDSAVLDPFAARGADAQTVARFGGGITDVRALESPGYPQFAEHRPFAAVDGDPATAWIVDRHLASDQRWLQVAFPRPRDVASVTVTPLDDPRATVRAVRIGGRRFSLHPGANRLAVRLHSVSTLRIELADVTHPRRAAGGGGGISELAIPGTAPTESLRPPVTLTGALAGADLRRDALGYVFARTTGDRPFARQPVALDPELGHVFDAGDAETVLHRTFAVPAARRFSVGAWTSVAATAPDPALDRLAGDRGAARFSSSSRFAGRPSYRASSAFAAGGPPAGWVGEWTPARGDWLQVSAPAPLRARRLTLHRSLPSVRHPTRVAVSWPGGSTGPRRVGRGGVVDLGETVVARRLRISVLAAAGGRRGVPAVGIGRVTGIAGLGAVAIPRSGPLRAACGRPALIIDGRRVALRVAGTVAQLDAGRPLRARGCGAGPSLPAGTATLDGLPGPIAVDELWLRSAAPDPPVASPGGGAVLAGGQLHDGSLTGARIAVRGPSWVVFGESYDRSWRATCDGRALGAPVALQGYGNGWPVQHGCRRLSFHFAPNATLVVGDLVSGAAAAVLLAGLLAAALVRRRRRTRTAAGGDSGAHPPATAPAPAPAPAWRSTRWRAGTALAAAVGGVAVLGFAFALRAGIVLGPLLGLALWRGVGGHAALALAGGLLVVVVPGIYMLHPVPDLGGYNPDYANVEIVAHFVAVLAWCALAYALVRSLAALRAARGGGSR